MRKVNSLSAQLEKKDEELVKAQLLKTEADKKAEEALATNYELHDQHKCDRQEVDTLKVSRRTAVSVS